MLQYLLAFVLSDHYQYFYRIHFSIPYRGLSLFWCLLVIVRWLVTFKGRIPHNHNMFWPIATTKGFTFNTAKIYIIPYDIPCYFIRRSNV